MVKQLFKNRHGFSLVEMIAVLMIVSIIVIILSRISINSYDKYQERLAVNELVSEIYNVQTKSLGKDRWRGYLTSKANTVNVKFDNSAYKIIVHLDTGYVTLDEIQ